MTRYEQARAALDNNIIPLQVYYRDVQILPDLERAGWRCYDRHLVRPKIILIQNLFTVRIQFTIF